MPRLVVAALLFLVVACGGAQRPPVPSSASPVALAPTPPGALRKCRAAAILRPSCPAQVPAAPYDPHSEIYDARVFATAPGAPRTFNFQWGGETPGRPERNRPPRMVHIVLVGGDFENEFPLGQRTTPEDGLIRMKRRAGLDLGPARWGNLDGRLILAPPFPLGGIDGNHLLFRWSDGGTGYQLGLHAWEPFTETVATLRAVVESLPRAS
jgi:hypothetical protein